MEYNYKSINKEDLITLQTLHNQSFKAQHSLQYVKKKYETNNFGKAPIGFLALDHHNFPSGYYGVFPIKISYDNEIYIASQSGDTMTHPDHRGKGLFMKLAQHTYERCAQENIEFVFGFTNSQSHRGFEKLGWEFNGKWKQLFFKTKFPSQIKYLHKIKLFKNIINANLGKLSISGANWQVHLPKQVKGIVIKDQSFFDYKKGYSSSKVIQYKGFNLFVKIDGELLIGDVSYFELSRMKDFIAAIQDLGNLYFCSGVRLMFSENHWLSDYARSINLPLFENEMEGKIGGKIFNMKSGIKLETMMFTLGDADFF